MAKRKASSGLRRGVAHKRQRANGEATEGSPNAQMQPKRPQPPAAWSDDPNFKIQYLPTRKGKTGEAKGRPKMEKSPFDWTLDATFKVLPQRLWNSLPQYRKFTILDEMMRVGDIVAVKNNEPVKIPKAGGRASSLDDTDVDDDDESELDKNHVLENNWIAKVMEVRAYDAAHVYLRVYWLYRPEDLPMGRQPYHGRNEVIPSNHTEIVEGLCVNQKVDVKHWAEFDDDDSLEEGDLFWRQTFDYLHTNLSEVRKHCIDSKPYNPDDILVFCSRPSCRHWMHAACIEDAAIKHAFAQQTASPSKGRPYAATSPAASHTSPKRPTPKRRRNSTIAIGVPDTHSPGGNSLSAVSPAKGRARAADDEVTANGEKIDIEVARKRFGAELSLKAAVRGEGGDLVEEPDDRNMVILTDLRDGRSWAEDVRCLFCNSIVD